MTSDHGARAAAQPLSDEQVQVSLRSPGDLADALPYLLGFHPDDSLVLVALHGEHGRFGGRMRVALPADAEMWPAVAEQLAGYLADGLLGPRGPARRCRALPVPGPRAG